MTLENEELETTLDDDLDGLGALEDEPIDKGGEGDEFETDEQPADTSADLEATRAQLRALQEDPDVAAVLGAKNAKRSLRIVVGDDAEESEEEDAPVPTAEQLNALDNAGMFSLLLRELPKAVQRDLAPTLSPLLSEAQERQRTTITGEMKRLAALYPDLREYKEDMVSLARQGMKPEEAYVVARLRKGKGLPPSRATRPAVERPSNVSVRSSGRKKAAPVEPGARGFSDALARTLETLDFDNL